SGASGQASAAQADSTRALYELMARVAEHFRGQLARSERARAYAAQRGLSAEIIERFAIGYAPDSWNELLRRIGGDERAQRELAAAGLVIERDRDASEAAGREGASLLRSLSRPADVSHPRHAWPCHRLRRPCHGSRGAQVPELVRDVAIPQGQGAVRVLRDAAG